MQSSYSINCNRQNWQALPERILYWVEQEALLLSDLHLERAAHLRKNGFPLPDAAHASDLVKLEKVSAAANVKKIFVLGDLFHSHTLSKGNGLKPIIEGTNAEWVLIKGNHDVFTDGVYFEMGFKEVVNSMLIDSVLLKHEPSPQDLKNHFCISGHLHPGYQLFGRGKQSLKLPCFYFGERQIILPAFSALTGLFKIRHQKNTDCIVVCSKDRVSKVENPKT